MDQDEGDQPLVAEYLSEARQCLVQLEQDLLRLESDSDAELIGGIFRAMHSLKGNAAFFAQHGVVALAHAAETLLDLIRSGGRACTGDDADALLAALDRLRQRLDGDGTSQDAEDEAVIARLMALCLPDAATDPGNRCASLLRIEADLERLRQAPDCRDGIIAGLSKVGEVYDCSRPLNELHTGTGSVVVVLDSPLEASLIADLYHLDAEAVSCQLPQTPARPATPDPETQTAPTVQPQPVAAAPPAPESPRKPDTSEAEATVRVSTRFLDDLLRFTGNMVMARNQMLSRYSFQDDASFATLSRCITDVHKSVVQQRMQKIESLFGRFRRMVRDLARKLAKEVNLVIEGSDIELDRTILEAFNDPLTHMVRNCVDHAIEAPEQRLAQGKSRCGRVVLRAYLQSSEVIIEVEDDGAGIDPGRVAAKAVERGLISPEQAAKLDRQAAQRLIFMPGFSTRDAASDLSGRGVGMDVVRTNIEAIGGAMELHSDPGQGSLFAFRLPLTQAIVSSSLIKALVVEAAGQRFAIPETAINEIIRVDPQQADDHIRILDGHHVYQLRDRVLSIVHLEDALGCERTFVDPSDGSSRPDRRSRIHDRRQQPPTPAQAELRSGRDRRRSKQTLVVVEFRRSYFGILVDRIAGVEEVVVRGSPRLLQGVTVFAGHTVLGDGSVVMMIDISGIITRMGLHLSESQDSTVDSRGALRTAQQMVVFDYAPQERFAIPLMMISLIEAIEARDIHRIGSREFYQLKQQTIPILRLEDQLDVSPARDRTHYHLIVPARMRHPIGILAGPDLSVEDFSDAFDSNNQNDRGLIGTAYCDGRLVMLLDLYALFEHACPELFAREPIHLDQQRPMRVLLAEDNHFFAKLVGSYLALPGVELVTVEDGQYAWDLLHQQRQRFDLIVSDIEMPRMNGFELVGNIKSSPDLQSVPVIALTSLADEESRRRGLKAGFDEYAVKIDKNELVQLIATYLKRP
ncbi:MAG: chemotaxis protein CheW [Planctomycetota bacterium]